QVFRKELNWGGRRLVLETGKIARQADGAVLATYGETTVLCTAVAAKSAKPGQDFFPLTVNYQEKTFAAGKIPGGFFKRDRRPPGRLYRWPICAEPDVGPAAELTARPPCRRHRRGRADGRVRGQGIVGRGHARRGELRAQELPAGYSGNNRARRDLRQGSLESRRAAGEQGHDRRPLARRHRTAGRSRLPRTQQAGAQQSARRGKAHGGRSFRE